VQSVALQHKVWLVQVRGYRAIHDDPLLRVTVVVYHGESLPIPLDELCLGARTGFPRLQMILHPKPLVTHCRRQVYERFFGSDPEFARELLRLVGVE